MRNIGKLNGQWKGDRVGYSALHNWVRRHLPTSIRCQNCLISTPHDVANISQKYKRDLSDWEWLCRKCHMTKDGRMKNLKRNPKEGEYKKCVVCNKEFYRQLSIASKLPCKYCSRACANQGNQYATKAIRQIYNNHEDVVFRSIVQASKYTGISKNAISHCLTGVSKTAGGFKWLYI